MQAATQPVQRPADAKLLHVDASGTSRVMPRSRWTELMQPGDVVIANDAATLPASLRGTHRRTGAAIEVRLAGRCGDDFIAVVFGSGDYRTRTEDRALPPPFVVGDVLQLGPLQARVQCILDHPRLLQLRMLGSVAAMWSGIAKHGRPIQYSHLEQHLQLWDTWTPIAGQPVAFEPPSAGFALDWQSLKRLRAQGVHFATLTHAAGISSTGDPALDARLPFDEPYVIPPSTSALVNQALHRKQRIVAIGTTVVRALEHAAQWSARLPSGPGIANQRLDARSRLRVVSALLSGTHEPETSHYQLLQAFIDAKSLRHVDAELERHRFRTHEFGDSVFIERQPVAQADRFVEPAPTSGFDRNVRGNQEKIPGCCAA